MSYFLKTHFKNFFVKPTLILIAVSAILNFPALSNNVSLDDLPTTLSTQEQTDLEQGKVILKGTKGQYIGKVIATGNAENAWSVLTDYNNFKDFLPNIASSRILQENGKKITFEQISVVDLWLLTKQFTVQIAATKTPLQKIDFEMLEGDLESLQGRWEITKVSPDRVLITHRVTVTPKSPTETAIFYGIYESSLEDTLKAIATEIGKRDRSTRSN